MDINEINSIKCDLIEIKNELRQIKDILQIKMEKLDKHISFIDKTYEKLEPVILFVVSRIQSITNISGYLQNYI